MENYRVKIDLEPEVKKVLINRYGHGDDIIRLTLHSVVGQIFAASSQKIGYQHYIPTVKEPRGITFEYCGNELRNHYLPVSKVPRVKRLLYHIVLEDLRVTCEAFRSMGNSDYNAVKFFCEKYGIDDEDISQETLRKRIREWERNQSKKNIKKSSAVSVAV